LQGVTLSATNTATAVSAFDAYQVRPSHPLFTEAIDWSIYITFEYLTSRYSFVNNLCFNTFLQLQTISFLAYLKHHWDISGPHLIISTLRNWAREFQQWTPDDMSVVILMGTKDERADIIANRLILQDFEVWITSCEICLIEKSAFKKFSFEYIVIDEAHRIKNVDSILSQIVRSFISRGRLLITGTPLQNSLKELFALLNFICPEIFTEYSDLDSFLHKDADGAEEEQSKKVVEALHKILRPFLLRRVKSDVEKNLLPSEFHAGS
jgi:SWI/SNF-related matrix-associated actin-dependent regulator of chromatin subfamily A member 5